MQISEFWGVFLEHVQYGGAIVSFVLNSILMLLIFYRSPADLGKYKYLMLYIVISQITYSLLDVITEPTVLAFGPTFLVFRNFKNSVLGREGSFLLIVVYCGYFGFSIALFAIHFIYRFGAAEKTFRDKYLTDRKLFFLFSMPVVIGIVWSAICHVFFHYDSSTDQFAQSLLQQNYNTPIEDVSYMIVRFYRLDEHNKSHPDPRIFFAIGCMWVLIILSLFCVFYFGVKCYLKLSRGLATIQFASEKARSLQQQLFLALVVQTTIPVILLYIPIFILYLFPMLNVDVGILGSFIAATIAIYPAIDPLPTMFIVKNFRDTLLCKKRVSELPVLAVN